ncbi:MAG: RCC1 domain-containing protein, partial [Bacteroidota bacterium]|nr:RCC1 domain-containing protein [Bacteroidota bacterium]
MDAWGITTPPETSFQQVSVGYDHVCALEDQTKVQCWGNSHEAKTIPPTNSRFERISAGGEHNCGILSSGRVECWGSNLHGQLDAVLGL